MNILTNRNYVTLYIEEHNLTISHSTRTPGSPLESSHFNLMINCRSDIDDIPATFIALHQGWGNPETPAIIGLQGSKSTRRLFTVNHYVPLEYLDFTRQGLTDKTLSSITIEYAGVELPEYPENGYEQRDIVAITLN